MNKSSKTFNRLQYTEWWQRKYGTLRTRLGWKLIDFSRFCLKIAAYLLKGTE